MGQHQQVNGNPRATHGRPMGDPWATHGPELPIMATHWRLMADPGNGQPEGPYHEPMSDPWIGTTKSPWLTHCSSMSLSCWPIGRPWDARRFCKTAPWVAHGPPTGLLCCPVVAHGNIVLPHGSSPLGRPWVWSAVSSVAHESPVA